MRGRFLGHNSHGPDFVVGVATLGVALAIVQKIHREYGSLEESEILEQIQLRNG